MHLNINPFFKKKIYPICFYLLWATAIYVGNKLSLGGPCVPGMGFLLFVLLMFINPALLVVSLMRVLLRREDSYPTMLIHLTAMIVLAIVIFY